jgi:hypothetical protein
MAHTGLMNSPGHRANIMRTAFRNVGIGMMDAGAYGLIVTQEFSNGLPNLFGAASFILITEIDAIEAFGQRAERVVTHS